MPQITSNDLDLWNAADAQLGAWLLDPVSAVDPDALAPSKISLAVAIQLASTLRFQGEPSPSAVVPDANGGILFEWQVGSESRSIEIDEGGHAEEVLIRDGHRIFRRPFRGL